MKKLVGIIGILALGGTMFINSNTTITANENLDLASVVTMNTANAECSEWSWPMKCNAFDRCSQFGSGGGCDIR